jgi:putative glutamine amidotransferase
MRPHHPRRPVIAVSPDITESTPETPLVRYELKVAYADAVLRAGGLPIVVPYSDDRQVIEQFLDRVSGVLITGGAFDVPPDAYGETPREGLGKLRPERTRFETALIKVAMARHLPVLGICGGMQLLNVALGGSLFQDIARELPNARPHQQNHDRTQPLHPIEVKDGTLLADCLGKGQVMVNSTHHQSVNRLGTNVVASATAPDGVIEAIEAKEYPWAVGVQWHPELLIDTVPPHLGLYRTFVNKAREVRR